MIKYIKQFQYVNIKLIELHIPEKQNNQAAHK